jgi:hypothetical protein
VSNTNAGRIAGALFLTAFVCYGVGNALVDRPVGVGLMLLNSVVVGTIGAIVFWALRSRHSRMTVIYLVARTLEAALLAVGVILLASTASPEGNDLAYQLAMTILGIGSVPFCWVLLKDRFLPGWLAIYGIVGYVLLAVGALLQLFGFAVGLVFSIPGGLFEIALGLILIARGFREPIAAPQPAQVRATRMVRSCSRNADARSSTNDRLNISA